MSPVCVLLMFVCLQRGQVSAAVPDVQTLDLKVEYGGSASLPCNGSAYLREKGIISWETSMGEKVAILMIEEENGWELIEIHPEVELPTEAQLRRGDWSLHLKLTRLWDSGTYQCIWEGKRQAIVSTVWLTVNEPPVEDDLLCSVGETVTLKCYLSLSWSQNPSSLQAGWTKDGHALEESFHYAAGSHRFEILQGTLEEFHLKISPAWLSDNGVYRCWYQTGDSKSPRPGLPNRITLSVQESLIKEAQTMAALQETVTSHDGEATEYTETYTWWDLATSSSEPTPHVLDVNTQPTKEAQTMAALQETVTSHDGEATEYTETYTWWDLATSSSEPTPHVLDVNTQPTKEAQTMAALQETVTSHDGEATTSNSLPWVRIGIIAGVLLVTSVVLGVLKARQKM